MEAKRGRGPVSLETEMDIWRKIQISFLPPALTPTVRQVGVPMQPATPLARHSLAPRDWLAVTGQQHLAANEMYFTRRKSPARLTQTRRTDGQSDGHI